MFGSGIINIIFILSKKARGERWGPREIPLLIGVIISRSSGLTAIFYNLNIKK